MSGRSHERRFDDIKLTFMYRKNGGIGGAVQMGQLESKLGMLQISAAGAMNSMPPCGALEDQK
jgi:hypothetical protein